MFRPALAEMEAYFRRLDARLSAEATLIVIGGAAVALGWDPAHATQDVDLWNNPGPEFWAAVEELRHFPEAVPVEQARVGSQPLNFEDRLRIVAIDGLRHLRIAVPEAHDLALMKAVRAAAHDLDAIEDIHRVQPLSLARLRERYEETLSTLIEPEVRFRWNFLAMVARLFGEACAESLEASMEAK